MLLRTLGDSLLGNLLIGKAVKVKIPGRGVTKEGEVVKATSQGRDAIRAH